MIGLLLTPFVAPFVFAAAPFLVVASNIFIKNPPEKDTEKYLYKPRKKY